MLYFFFFFFFFSSRRRHTRLQGDWSSDVCSSDLHQILGVSPFGLGDRKARRDVVAWMNGKSTDIRVVEVEEAEGCAIGEGCKIRRRAPSGSDDRGATGHRKRDLATDPDCSFLERSDTAADRVDDVHLDPLDGRGIEVVVAQGMGIGGQLFRERSLARWR